MYIHNLDPIIFEFGVISLRWYSLSYIVGIILGWWQGNKIILKLNNKNALNLKKTEYFDVSSGVENSEGIKDEKLISEFISKASKAIK